MTRQISSYHLWRRVGLLIFAQVILTLIALVGISKHSYAGTAIYSIFDALITIELRSTLKEWKTPR